MGHGSHTDIIQLYHVERISEEAFEIEGVWVKVGAAEKLDF